MATKTLILRPISVTCDNETKVTLYPSDTTMTNAHMLVNEKVADDDATYISTAVGGAVYYYFEEYKRPTDLLNIISINFVFREKLESGTSGGYYLLGFGSTSGQLFVEGTLDTSAYNNIIGESPSGHLEYLSNLTSDSSTYIKRYPNTNSSKGSPLRTTQVYMEVTYEALDPIYMKKDNTYALIDCNSVYLKIDDSWVLSNSSIFQDGKKYIVKEVE